MSRNVSLLETPNLTESVPGLSIFEYQSQYSRFSHAHRLAERLADGRIKAINHCCGIRHETDIVACGFCWLLIQQWFAGAVSPTDPFDMMLICHLNELSFVQWLYAFIRRYCEKSIEKNGFDWKSLFCFERPYDKFYLVCEAG